MKKNWLFLLLCLFVEFTVLAQETDLASLSSGELQTFHVLYDVNDKVFGYFLVYDKGLVSKTEREFEFTVLDKNLRQLNTNKVVSEDYVVTFSGYLDYNNDLILYPRVNEDVSKTKAKRALPSSYKVDMKTNTVTAWNGYCYENDQIVLCDRSGTFKERKEEVKKEKKENGFVRESDVYRGKYDGYLVVEYDDYEKYTKNYTLRKFDDQKKEQWSYTIDDEVSKKHYYFVRVSHIDSSHIYGFKIYIHKNKFEKCNFMVWDMKTGKLKKEQLINDVTAESILSMLSLYAQGLGSNIDSSKDFDTKIVFTGRISDYFDGYTQSSGYFRAIIDKKTLDISFKKLDYKLDFKKHLPKISETGNLEKGYSLSIRDAFFLIDGSIIYIFEKYKLDSGFMQFYGTTDDLIFVITDAAYNIKNVKVMEKEKTKKSASNYLFGQYLNDGKDFAFFYQDYKKDKKDDDEKNWVLFINTWIDGQLNNEELIITSKNNAIYPYIAKEGYILLREYNEKAKYNQIRLEKLNF